MMDETRFSVVIPAHNEQDNIAPLLEDLLKLRKKIENPFEIVVVNDNSSDKTGGIAEEYSKKYKNIKVVHRSKGNNGMGFALVDGTKKATHDITLWVMGDRSDSLETIPKIVGRIGEGYNLVTGSRYITGGSRGDLDLFKSFLSMGYSLLARAVFGVPTHDITNAFRGFRREVFDSVRLESGDFAISPEFAIKAHIKGYKLGEVPTGYSNRRAGQAKFDLLRMGIRYFQLFKYKFTGD
ncbi:MAG: glycosyltransferase [Candidatus Altiarchaeota archaeon]|nr:glycosyltransferase [Candidatus Altiarchaeota archaeon]